MSLPQGYFLQLRVATVPMIFPLFLSVVILYSKYIGIKLENSHLGHFHRALPAFRYAEVSAEGFTHNFLATCLLPSLATLMDPQFGKGLMYRLPTQC